MHITIQPNHKQRVLALVGALMAMVFLSSCALVYSEKRRVKFRIRNFQVLVESGDFTDVQTYLRDGAQYFPYNKDADAPQETGVSVQQFMTKLKDMRGEFYIRPLDLNRLDDMTMVVIVEYQCRTSDMTSSTNRFWNGTMTWKKNPEDGNWYIEEMSDTSGLDHYRS